MRHSKLSICLAHKTIGCYRKENSADPVRENSIVTHGDLMKFAKVISYTQTLGSAPSEQYNSFLYFDIAEQKEDMHN